MRYMRLLPSVVAALALVVAWFVYSPGLRGGFLFDDFANLPSLGATGPVRDTPSFLRYVTSGTADPTGRPISVASFLIDAQDWPADPLPFKRTNVIVHLLNGLLLFSVLRTILRITIHGDRARTTAADLTAALTMAFWLLHPRLVSTTLYIVQREAMLPATFTLIGVLGWLAGRRLLAQDKYRQGVLLEFGSLAICTVLATLSKANGILLPVLVLALEYTVLPPLAQGQSVHARTRALTCWTVFAALAAYVVYQGVANTIAGIDYRTWTEGQRLLTEPRILWTYLYDLWIPKAYSAGLFNDAYTVSTSLVTPWTTLPAIVGIILFATSALAWRRALPLYAAAVLFYLGGHLIESTTVPLELYFEHRNYLPSMLLFLPAAAWLAGLRLQATQPSDKPAVFLSAWPWRAAISVVALATLATMTFANARIWGDDNTQALIWARLNPDSARAQVTAAAYEMAHGNPGGASRRLTPLLVLHPNEVQLSFNLLSAHCATGTVTPDDIAAASYSLRHSRDPGALIVSWYDRIIPIVQAGTCRGLTLGDLKQLARDGTGNPLYPPGRRQDLAHAQGVVDLSSGQPGDALASFNAALDYNPQLETALAQAAMLGEYGYPTLGLAHLAHYDGLPRQPKGNGLALNMPALHRWVLDEQQYWEHERAVLENTLIQAENESP